VSQLRENSAKSFPDWDSLYRNEKVQMMPWYYESLDADLEQELEKRKIRTGRILDLGTGPATQAMELYRRGLSVTGSDLSSAAIQRAKKTYAESNDNMVFVVDNILDSRLSNDGFDYIFDRGCFHVMPADKRSTYVGEIKRILRKHGLLFLKCFSTREQREEGPYKFSETDIENIFDRNFSIESVKETVYQGTLDPLPRALFVVMKRK
jgi:SAM-dependent methyltransferase